MRITVLHAVCFGAAVGVGQCEGQALRDYGGVVLIGYFVGADEEVLVWTGDAAIRWREGLSWAER